MSSYVTFRRLSWAGVEVRYGWARLLVDPLETTEPLAAFLGLPKRPLVPVEVDETTWALVTHLHADHCDRYLLSRIAPNQTLCHDAIAEALRADGMAAAPVELWRPRNVGPFCVTPVPSADWRGDDQVAWVIEIAGARAIHCGDTIWHGGWYEIAARFTPFDLAFLPISGVIARLDGFTPTEVPATLTPEQAVEAAVVLRARTACAIHHGLFDNPPGYSEQPDAISRFLAAGKRRGVIAAAPDDGDVVVDVPTQDCDNAPREQLSLPRE
jgi:L-ascorbate metabolism protein UlaG (beta-lactamase superfamily)